ncbi:MAG: Gfo/Idh/MocA family protein [Bacteroidota bacterium]
MSVGVAIIGQGYWGKVLTGKFARHPDFHVVAVCRRTPFTPDELDRLPGVAALTDLGAAINAPGVEVVVVATPAASHFGVARQAVDAGRHVFLEKPPTQTLAEAEELDGLAQRLGRVVMVDHTFLFTPAYQALRQLVDAGRLGTLQHIHSTRADFGSIPSDVNISAHLVYHDLYLIQDLCRGEPERVKASAASHVLSGITDTMTADLAFADGSTATVVANMLFPRKVRQVVVAGDAGILEWDETVEAKLRLWPHRSENVEGRIVHHHGLVESVAVAQGDALDAELAHLHECLAGRATPRNGLTQAIAVMRTVQRLDEAAGS